MKQRLKKLIMPIRFTVCCLLTLSIAEGAFSTFAYAQVVSSIELISNAKYYDGKEIIYEGEVIGDVMVRNGFAWINLHDGKAAIGVWIKSELTENIIHTGKYNTRGDWVAVTGVFHRRCPEHGGGLNIGASSIKILQPGERYEEEVDLRKIRWVLALGVGVLLAALYKYKYKAKPA